MMVGNMVVMEGLRMEGLLIECLEVEGEVMEGLKISFCWFLGFLLFEMKTFFVLENWDSDILCVCEMLRMWYDL